MDKWKEPILKNTEDQLAWTMAYETGCGPLDPRSFHKWVVLGR